MKSLQLLIIASSLVYAADLFSGYKSIAYWGRDLMSLQHPNEPKYWERDLKYVCQDPNVEFIHIYGVNSFFGANNYLTMALSDHCTKTFPGFTKPASGSVLLQCPGLATEIASCQANGKKIILVIAASGTPAMKTEQDGVTVAHNIWNSFLGGSGNRPFGNVVLDGIDLWIRDVVYGYPQLVSTLRSLMNADTSRTYYIAGTPQCSYPDLFYGPGIANYTLTTQASAFDYLNIDTTNTPQCNYVNPSLFYNAITQWSTFASTASNGSPIPFFVMLSASAYVGSSGAFIPISTIIQDNVIPQMLSAGQFSGLSFMDYSVDDQSQPCGNDGRTYSQLLRAMIVTPTQFVNFTCSASTSNGPITRQGSGAGSPVTDIPSSAISQYKPSVIMAVIALILVNMLI